jgi:small subunit ribosomal protein S17
MAGKKDMPNIGLNVKLPETICTDQNCPFHGTLPVRGQVLTGTVISTKMQGSIAVKKEFLRYIQKYERYEKRSSIYHAHCPPCLNIKEGDTVRIAECRPLSKTVSFVTVEKI